VKKTPIDAAERRRKAAERIAKRVDALLTGRPPAGGGGDQRVFPDTMRPTAVN
jgi:hypothetical protein